jgi:hypothetical protein
MGWVTKLDNTFWAATSGATTWDGTKWTNIDNIGAHYALNAIGGWNVGYRPTQMRLTLSIGSAQSVAFHLYTTDVDQLDTSGSPAALTTTPTQFVFDLDFTPVGIDVMDMTDLWMFAGVDPATVHIHNIEFFENSAFWQDKVKCTETDA